MSDSDRPTSEMPVLPSWQPNGHACVQSAEKDGRCGHCDTGYICPHCGHHGMQTVKDDPRVPAHFVLRCPVCNTKRYIHWIEYDVKCPRCGREDAVGTHTKTFERIIRCKDCGEIPRGEAA